MRIFPTRLHGRPWTSVLHPMALAVLAASLGCAGSSSVAPPALNPDAAAARAMAEFDRNQDGFLDSQELAWTPALKSALKSLDTNHDGKISEDELLDRLQQFKDTRVGLFATSVKVVLDGKPLAGVSVDFEPEAFLGPAIKPAHGTTDDSGRAAMCTDGFDIPGCQFGFYNVRLSKKDAAGQELIPARYASTLGTEIPKSNGAGIVFTLSSK